MRPALIEPPTTRGWIVRRRVGRWWLAADWTPGRRYPQLFRRVLSTRGLTQLQVAERMGVIKGAGPHLDAVQDGRSHRTVRVVAQQQARAHAADAQRGDPVLAGSAIDLDTLARIAVAVGDEKVAAISAGARAGYFLIGSSPTPPRPPHLSPRTTHP